MKDLRMCIHFGFAGYQSSTAPAEAYRKIDSLIAEFLTYAAAYNSPEYGFTGEPIRYNLFSGDLFVTPGIRDYARTEGIPMTLVTSAHEPIPGKEAADSVIALDVRKTNLSYPNITAEYVVNQSDVVFLLWDGNQNFQEGSLWTILQLCKQKHIPYYLINTKKLEEISFSSDSYYVPYNPEFVHDYVAALYNHQEKDVPVKPILLSGLWKRLYGNFINKHGMKAPESTSVTDQILLPDFFPANHVSAKNHTILAQCYQHYNAKASAASKMYRSSIYFRSILPLIAIVFLAIGTHVETIFKFLPINPTIRGFSLWAIMAGLGFLSYALINLYAYAMEKNPSVDRLRTDFIEARFIAEYLRVLIHGEAYGIQLDNVCMDTPLVERHVLAKLHHILRMQEPVTYIQTKGVMNEAIENFNAFVDAQTTYHEYNVKRYKNICLNLEKLSNTLFTFSFAVVFMSCLLQPIAPYLGTYFGCSAELLNALADIASLMIPAWASYASSKLTMNNFKWLYENSEKMLKAYGNIQRKLDEIQRRNNNTCQIMNDIANDIMQYCQEDFTNWYLRTGAQTFTRL